MRDIPRTTAEWLAGREAVTRREIRELQRPSKESRFAVVLRLGDAELTITEHGVTLGQHGTRITNAEGRLGSHASRIGAAEGRITNAEGRLDSHASRIGAVENQLGGLVIPSDQAAYVYQLTQYLKSLQTYLKSQGLSGAPTPPDPN